MKRSFVVLSLLALTSCAATATLYPANDAATKMGPLQATITRTGTGSGPITVTLPDGEVLNGRYSVNVGGSMGFGSLYGSVYGANGYASGSAFSSTYMVPNSSGGAADLMGPKGTTAHCEFMNNNWSGHGNGACQLSNGATYRVQY